MTKRNVSIVIAAVIVIAVALGLYHLGAPRPGVGPAPPAPPPGPSAAKPAAEAPRPPSFDAVHIGPDGKAVIAGRAEPGAEVTVLDHGQAIGHATADTNGEWVLMPDQALAPGAQELSLDARKPGTSEPTHSSASIAVLVPERQPAGPQSGAVAVLLPQGEGGAARPVQVPGGRGARHVVLDIVEYDAAGRTIITGRADAGARVDLYVNGGRVESTTADAQGNWSVQLASGVPAGRYRLRLAAIDADGSAGGELSVDLRRAAPGELAVGDYLAVIPGNTLWHLAQHSYGEGERYVEIYRANRAKVDNPDRIFPGQLLALPAKP